MSDFPQTLSDDEIHVWHMRLDDDLAEENVARALLDEAERTRHAGFSDVESARNFMLVRAALRLLLGRYLRVSPASIMFQYGTYGKPALFQPAQPRIEFNVSHAQDRACLAFARNQPVGVDIENRFHRGSLNAVARRFFTAGEQAMLNVGDQALYAQRFFALWSAKEALLKAGGEGVANGLEQREVTLDSDGVPRSVGDNDLHLHALEISGNYHAAVATVGRGLSVWEGQFEWADAIRQAQGIPEPRQM